MPCSPRLLPRVVEAGAGAVSGDSDNQDGCRAEPEVFGGDDGRCGHGGV